MTQQNGKEAANSNQILAGSTAVVTGAGSGIGKCIVKRFLETLTIDGGWSAY